LLQEQCGCCAICLRPGSSGLGRVGLSVDHNHETGRIRGLLCDHCNHAIGAMREDVERIKRAIAYLEKWRGQ
jgi:hypothetical protein